MKEMIVRQECRFFVQDRPCRFHKTEGVVCDGCSYFAGMHPRILIIKLDALGDVLRTMAILPPLKKKYPDSYITWITRENALPLFENSQLVDEVLCYGDPAATHLLYGMHFDIVINPDTNRAAAMMASLADADEKMGFVIDASGGIAASNEAAYEWFLMGINDELKKLNTKTYQRIILDMLDLDESSSYIPLILSDKERESGRLFREEYGLDGDGHVIGLNVGAGGRWQNKVWPLEHYEVLIDRLIERRMHIVLLGGSGEKDRLAVLKQKFGDKVVSADSDNSLREFFSILNICDIIVSSDTMAAHAGLALEKKAVILFGPTSVNEFETYGRGIKLTADIDCLVCYRTTCTKKPNCMDLLSPKTVEHALLRLAG